MSTVAIIPARGGSKGIKDKNLQEVDGTPLVARTIIAAQNSDRIDEVCVSSDDLRILKVAEELGADAILRPGELSGDNATSEESLNHAIAKYTDATIMVFLQCTSPFTRPEDIDAAVYMLERSGVDCVFSAVETHSGYWVEDLYGPRCLTQDQIGPRLPRQMSIPTWRETGGIYAIRVKSFLDRWPLTRFCGSVKMLPVSDKSAFEIDTQWELEAARAIEEL